MELFAKALLASLVAAALGGFGGRAAASASPTAVYAAACDRSHYGEAACRCLAAYLAQNEGGHDRRVLLALEKELTAPPPEDDYGEDPALGALKAAGVSVDRAALKRAEDLLVEGHARCAARR